MGKDGNGKDRNEQEKPKKNPPRLGSPNIGTKNSEKRSINLRGKKGMCAARGEPSGKSKIRRREKDHRGKKEKKKTRFCLRLEGRKGTENPGF